MLDRVSKVIVTAALMTGINVALLPGQAQQAGQPAAGQQAAGQPAAGQPAQPQKNWKDRAEYDIYNAIVKEQDTNKRLTLLNTWKEKYPTSDYAPERLQVYLTTYNALNQPDKVIAAGNEVLQQDPKNLTALYLITMNTPRLTKPGPDDLSSGEKAGNGLVSNLDTFFAADKKPASTTDADWTKARNQTEELGHVTLGWVALQRKDDDAAEKEFGKALQLNPNNAQVSYWLGTAILQEKKPERQAEALYHFARAASLDPAHGGFPAQARQSIDQYFVQAYNKYHGDDAAGLQQLRDLAKSSAMPPANFKIETGDEAKLRKEQEVAKQNPSLALWQNLKQELTGPNGEQYFNQNMKDANVPGGAGGVDKFKGKLISMKPALRPKELVLAIVDANSPEVTLNLDAPLPGKADPGTEIEFSGVPKSFRPSPFNVSFEVEKKNIAGWPGKDAAAPRRTGAKKGTAHRAKKG